MTTHLLAHADQATCVPCRAAQAIAARLPIGTPILYGDAERPGRIGAYKAPKPEVAPHQVRLGDAPEVAQVVANKHGMITVYVSWDEGGAGWVAAWHVMGVAA